MKKITKTLFISVLAVTVLGTTALAVEGIKTPAQAYSETKGITVEEAYEARGTNKTFGQLAQEDEKLDEFEKMMLESKKAIIEDRVEKKLITREKADALLEILDQHDCNGPGEQQEGKNYDIGFGKGIDDKGAGYAKERYNRQNLRDGSGTEGDHEKRFGYGRAMGRNKR